MPTRKPILNDWRLNGSWLFLMHEKDVIMREMGKEKRQGGPAERRGDTAPQPWQWGRSGFM
jgi:hypothetical protein